MRIDSVQAENTLHLRSKYSQIPALIDPVDEICACQCTLGFCSPEMLQNGLHVG